MANEGAALSCKLRREDLESLKKLPELPRGYAPRAPDIARQLFHSFEALNNAGFCDKSNPDEALSPNTWADDEDDPRQAPNSAMAASTRVWMPLAMRDWAINYYKYDSGLRTIHEG